MEFARDLRRNKEAEARRRRGQQTSQNNSQGRSAVARRLPFSRHESSEVGQSGASNFYGQRSSSFSLEEGSNGHNSGAGQDPRLVVLYV